MTLLALLAGTALAGQVFVNGVRADVLPPVTLERCTVRVDASGNIYIDAPGYKVAVAQPGDPAPVAGMYGAPAPLPGVTAGAVATVSAAAVVPPTLAVPADPPPVPPAARVPASTWWLVVEDARSSGQILELRVNGNRVRTFRSGEPQLVLDVGPWLRSGENVLELLPQGDASGGALSVHVGKGSPAAGVLRLEAPEFTYTRRGNEPAVPSRASLIVR